MEESEIYADKISEVAGEEYVVIKDDEFVGVAIDQFRDYEPEDEHLQQHYRMVPRSSPSSG